MIYTLILVVFGVLPLFALWFFARRWLPRYAGVLFWLALLIVVGGATWELLAIDRIWFYAPNAIWGARLMNLPVEEWAYYILDALLVATLTLVVRKALSAQGHRRNVEP